MKKTLHIVFALLFIFPLAGQQEDSQNIQTTDVQKILLKDIVENLLSYQNRELKLVLRLQYVYLDVGEVSFYDEENYNIKFDIKNYRENRLYQKSLKHSYRGREYVVTCTITDIENDGFILARLIQFEPYSLYQLPY
jgi:hypothetical protein